ncbi:metallophosphoesterase, partial [Mycolicibacterium brumae]|uniref:metallophosphoesterase n=1 Tax=Mycolicibacterium brumae TaxID=85968 RepID=UPI0019513FDE
MTPERLAFVGDIHGNLPALRGILYELEKVNLDRIVFLGDYIDRGEDSAGVLRLLCESAKSKPLVLRGNHEEVLLKALDTGDLAHFLKIGGAST